MAFRGRGDMSSIENNNGVELQREMADGYYRYYGFYYYVPLDNTYVLMQMIVAFIILIVGVITYFATYQATIVDPIESTKKLFINMHLMITGVLLVITFIINLRSKNKELLIKRLIMTAIISIFIMLMFLGMKLNLDTTYTKDKFEEFYTEQNSNEESSNKKSKIDIGLTGMSVKTEKEYYIDESMKLYRIFSMKTYGTIGLHLLLNLLLIYQIVRVQKMEDKKEKLSKDDLILFDEEQNIRY